MASDLARSTQRAAEALAHTIWDRLVVDDHLDGREIYRASKTLTTLVQSLVDERGALEDIALVLDQVMMGLVVRVGESIDDSQDDDAYNLGRAVDLIATMRRRCRRELAG